AEAVETLQPINDRVANPEIRKRCATPTVHAESSDLRLRHGCSLDEVANEPPVDFVFQVLEGLSLVEVLRYSNTLNVRPELLFNVRDRALGLRVLNRFSQILD